MDVRNQLVEFGFAVSRIEAALRNISDPSLENAIEWLEQHPIENAVTADDVENGDDATATGPDGEPVEKGELSEEAGSLVCQDCGKRFRTPATAEFHATKTQHTNFAESTEKIPELTPEQKKAKLDELRERAAERKAQAAKDDVLEARNNEILRRKADKEQATLIEKQKRMQVMKDAEDRRRQAKEDALAKQRIRDLIAADKKSRQEKLEKEKAARAGIQLPVAAEEPQPQAPSSAPKQKKEYTESRLQIRVDGQPPVVKTFPLDATLFEVAHSVQDHSGIPPTSAAFVTTFPTRRFGPEDMGMTVKEVGFINTAVMLKRA
ncbi:hypothetical protein V1525DRAFT_406795 [Lipomyces kononenkoae]|uniref:Uncharacterized protein n=1 Tax=Lipomyces kononenkoae TaxID=34357 RepID=A0ACC3SYS5_LIPKO